MLIFLNKLIHPQTIFISNNRIHSGASTSEHHTRVYINVKKQTERENAVSNGILQRRYIPLSAPKQNRRFGLSRDIIPRVLFQPSPILTYILRNIPVVCL